MRGFDPRIGFLKEMAGVKPGHDIFGKGGRLGAFVEEATRTAPNRPTPWTQEMRRT
jgi:hypothetical protein